MPEKIDHRRTAKSFRAGFSLIELLAVITIGSILMGLAIMAASSIGRAKDLTRAAYDIADLLQMARTHALAKNTPVEFGFHEDADGISIAVIAERELGGNEFSELGRVRRFPFVRLNSVPADNPVRPVADAQISQLDEGIEGISAFTVSGREFSRVIHFNSRGEARVADDSLSRVIEVGLVAKTQGTSPAANSAAVQVTALAGGVRVYRP